MFVVLAGATGVDELFIDASAFVVLIGGLLLTLGWLWALYRD